MTKADMLKIIWDYEGFTFVPSHSKKIVEKRYLEIQSLNNIKGVINGTG